MSKIKILVAEDEVDLLEIVTFNLTKEGYEVIPSKDGKEAYDKAILYQPQMVILDIMMPKYNGIEICEALRNREDFKNTFILLVTALDDDEKQIEGLEKGADDYIIKPVSQKILNTKIKSFLRRDYPSSKKNKIIQIENICIDPSTFIITYKNTQYILTKKQFLIVYFLASHPNVIMNRTDIINNVWGKDTYIGDRTIDVHIRKIRQQTGIKNIVSLRGVGYQFKVEKV